MERLGKKDWAKKIGQARNKILALSKKFVFIKEFEETTKDSFSKNVTEAS